MAPIVSTSGTIALTTRDRFLRELAMRQEPALAVQPLGHALGGTPGVAHGIVTTVSTVSAVSAASSTTPAAQAQLTRGQAPRRRERTNDIALAADTEAVASALRGSDDDSSGRSVVVAAPPAPSAPTPHAAAPLPTVTRPAPAAPRQLRASVSAPRTAPVTSPSSAASPRATPAQLAPPAIDLPPRVDIRRTASNASLAPDATMSSPDSHAGPAASAARPPATPSPAPETASAQSAVPLGTGRLRIAAPLHDRPPSWRRVEAAPPAPVAPPRAAAQTSRASTDTQDAATAAPDNPRHHAPAFTSADLRATSLTPLTSPRRLTAAAPQQQRTPAAAPPAAAVALSSHRPLGSRVQRAPDTVPNAVRRVLEPALGTDLSGVRVHRDDASAAAARSLHAQAFTAGGEVHIPAAHGPLDTGKGRELLAHELVHVAQQRSHGASLPHEDSPRGQALEAEAVAAGARWSDAGPHTVTAPSATGRTVPTTRPSAPPVVAQRAPVAASAAPAPPANPASSAQVSDTQLDELARRLYLPLRRQLRTELLVDRERSGRTTDR